MNDENKSIVQDTQETQEISETPTLSDRDLVSIPFFAHEAEVERLNKMNKRLFALCIILFLGIVGQRVGQWLYDSQYEDIIITQEADTDAGGNITMNGTGIGDINYGESETND